MPKVSIIIPCYNQGRYIEEAVNSVLAQSFTDWEIIIINDGSTDKFTNNFLKDYRPSNTSIYFTENKGVSAARNFAIDKSLGKYILPLDSDDYIAMNYLRDAVDKLEMDPELKLVYGEGEYVGDLAVNIVLPSFSMNGMLQQNLIFCTALYRKSGWAAAGKYDETFETGWEDWDFWLRLIDDEKQVYKLPSSVFYYRIKKDSRNASLQGKQLVITEQQLFKKHLDKYLTHFPLPITQIRNIAYLKEEKENFEKVKQKIYHSLSYRVGHFLLKPFKMFSNRGT